MYQVGVIGDRDSVIGFKALGMTVREAESGEKAAELIRQMASDKFAVIYITEPLAEENQTLIQVLRQQPLPAIVPIPSITGSTGLGMRQVKESVRKAVGIDLFDSAESSADE
ncbi:MAG: V-type ATP synthase subunit F [Clostridia bacterium]|jgi:V/A-type H+-transporting ATPase subunit F|nr:V-type ATP synthase subunit F [Eubacteriales bacterium]MDD3865995.1 V-type ATP synthase subunit F [Eubacteriales bacterium]MDD4461417.1 V-type ATP synthase subunit F [Eubacteriales bacterium]NCC48278.1 V-type ATP synthase subunit F [Clostridia bacterium]